MEDIAEDNSIKIVPKLTIKMDGSATDSPFYVDKSPRSEQKIPKITLKTGTDHAIIIRHNQLNQLPKITIKTNTTKSVENSVQETAMHGSPNKLMARQINDPVNEERVPKIMISRDKTGDVSVEKVQQSSQSESKQQTVHDVETIEILSSSSNCSSDVKIPDSGLEAETETVLVEEDVNGLETMENENEEENVVIMEEKTEAIHIVENHEQIVDPVQTDEVVDEIPIDMPPKVRRRGRPRKQVFEDPNKKTDDSTVKVVPADEESSQKPEEESQSAVTPSPQKLNRSYRGRGRGRGRGSRGGGTPATPRGRGGLKHSPNIERAKALGGKEIKSKAREIQERNTSLQVFEEDTQMDPLDITEKDIKDIKDLKDVSYLNNEDTQNSISSSTSNTVKKKYRSKLDVIVPESTNYGPSNIAEYDWPPPKGCCPSKNRETYMIQEQIANYLGITSFKRKYPDLPRRAIDHEEKSYLQEKGLVTEKMCDLGITAVFASDILDIMYCDFYDKYEEYKNYLRQKSILDRDLRKNSTYDPAKGLPLKKKSQLSVQEWNAALNKSRKTDRQACFDLQNLVEHVPRHDLYKKVSTQSNPSHYPISIVPGQFCDYYRQISSEELKYYPLNTSKMMNSNNSTRFNNLMNNVQNKRPLNEDSGTDCESSDDSTSSSSDEEEDVKRNCAVCHKPQSHNKMEMPEVFIKCYTCKRTVHPSCIEMTTRMFKRCRTYNWQCSDCKCCVKCKNTQSKSKMLFCEQCDRGYHIYCLKYKIVPDSRWSCEKCTICMNCGSSTPLGVGINSNNVSKHKKVKWINDYSYDHITKLREHSVILCIQCGRNNHNSRKINNNLFGIGAAASGANGLANAEEAVGIDKE